MAVPALKASVTSQERQLQDLQRKVTTEKKELQRLTALRQHSPPTPLPDVDWGNGVGEGAGKVGECVGCMEREEELARAVEALSALVKSAMSLAYVLCAVRY
eukprot:3940787-Rhodomonas_salina.1